MTTPDWLWTWGPPIGRPIRTCVEEDEHNSSLGSESLFRLAFLFFSLRSFRRPLDFHFSFALCPHHRRLATAALDEGTPPPPSLNKSRVAVRQNRVESYGNADCMRGGPLTDRNAEPLSRLYAAKFRSRRCTHWRLQVQLSHQLANAIKKQWPLCVPLILAHYS